MAMMSVSYCSETPFAFTCSRARQRVRHACRVKRDAFGGIPRHGLMKMSSDLWMRESTLESRMRCSCARLVPEHHEVKTIRAAAREESSTTLAPAIPCR